MRKEPPHRHALSVQALYLIMKKPPEYRTWELQDFRAMLDGIGERYPDNIAYTWRDPLAEDGVAARTYTDMLRDIKALATYLCAMGLEGRRIAVCGKNSYRWALSFLAVVSGCGVAVPLDRELRTDELTAFLRDAACSAILYEDDMQAKLDSASLSQQAGLLCLPLSSIDVYLSQGAALRDAGSRSYENHTVDPDALGVLLYTSGTAGGTKGVMLSQRNLCADITGVCTRIRITESDRVLSHMPAHHIYEITTSLAVLYSGGSIAFNESIRRMPSDLTLFRPTILVTVPAVLDFITRFISRGYADARGGKLLLGAQKLAVGMVSNPLGVFSKRSAEQSRRRIFSTVHSFMGGRLRAVVVGAAPLSPAVFEQIEKFGYAVYAGYGLTEAAPAALMHHDHYRSSDDVGFPVPGVEVRIDFPDEVGIGELCIKGPTVMLGYYNNEDATASAIRDGWLYTGDLAQQTASGAYRIIGRKKSVIVLPTGKKITPEELESYFTENPLVSECLVYAEEQDGDTMLCVSVYPDMSALIRSLSLPDGADLTQLSEADTARAKTLLLDVVRAVNAQLPSYKHVKKLVVRKTEFAKTAAQKIRRGIPENTDNAANAIIEK